MFINSQSAEDTYNISTIMTKIYCNITGNNNKKGLQRKKSNIYQLHSSVMHSWQHCKIWCSFMCVCACLCGGARPSTPRPELEESPLISTRIGEEPFRDVTSPLPLSLNLHFLWVLAECTCVRQTLNT